MKITALLLTFSGAQAFTSVSNNMRFDTAVSSSNSPDESWFFQHNGSIQQEDHLAPQVAPDNWMYEAWGGVSQEDFAYTPTGETDWCYQPWSGIQQTDFYPVSHAGNRMMSQPPANPAPSMPPPAPEMPQQAAPPPMPEQTAPQQMPEQTMPEMENAGVQAQA